MDYGYWSKQDPSKPLFADIAWQKPEQKRLAGKLLIIGGSSHGFAAVAQAYSDVAEAGIGESRALLPDALKSTVTTSSFDCLFGPSNPSGGFSTDSLPIMQAAAAWADGLLLIGDTGRNSETAIVLEKVLMKSETLTIITRDAVDLLSGNASQLLKRPNTVFVVALAQLQKLLRSVYYPKTILFSMSLVALVEALHAFTITYPASIAVFHQGQLVVASNGRVSTTPWANPLLIWRGSVAAKMAVYAIQQPSRTFEALTTSLV